MSAKSAKLYPYQEKKPKKPHHNLSTMRLFTLGTVPCHAQRELSTARHGSLVLPFTLLTNLYLEALMECIMAAYRQHVVLAFMYTWLKRRRRRRYQRLRSIMIESAQRRQRFFISILSFLLTVMLGNTAHELNSQWLPRRIHRSVWCVERSTDWWERVVLGTYTDRQWIDDFRMTKNTFFLLCRQLRPYVTKKQSKFCKTISHVHRVEIAVYQFASGANFRTVGNLFGVSRATVCLAVHSVTNAITDNLLPVFVKFPEGERLQQVVNGFEQKYGFPQCVGAIDGTHSRDTTITIQRGFPKQERLVFDKRPVCCGSSAYVR